MKDSNRTVRPHKDYAKHGRAAKRTKKRLRPRELEKTAQSPKIKPERLIAIPRPITAKNIVSSKGLDKIRIVRLLLAGAAPKDISIKANISIDHCRTMIKEIESDIQGLTWQDYLSLLLSKIRLLLDNHTQNSADIQMMLLDCDMSIKDTQSTLEGITDKAKRLPLSYHLTRLRAQRITLMRELNANNTALTGNLSKMGVTNVPLVDKNKVPTQSSNDNNIPLLEGLPASYTDMGRGELLEALGASNRDVGRYLRAETARKKAESE